MDMPHVAMTPVWAHDFAPEASSDLTSTYDVVVVGAGIVGATAAAELAFQGRRVALIDAAEHPGTGVTGQSTAKVTEGHGLRLSEVLEKHGHDAAVEYATAATAGLDYVRGCSSTLPAVSCRSVPHDLYSSDEALDPVLAAHGFDARECGLTVEGPGAAAALPAPARTVVRYPDQLIIDPVVYVERLVRTARNLGADVCLDTVVTGVESGPVVQTSRGDISAGHVVLATHVPFSLRTLAFALVEQRRHYAVSGVVEGPVGTTYDVAGGWSTRPLELPGDPHHRAIAVGPGHPAGEGEPAAAMHRLHAWAQTRLGMRITHAWSTQDAFGTDGLPLVGNAGLGPEVYIATGFGGWGLTLGTAAALDIVRRIQGEPGRIPTWEPHRTSLLRHPGVSLEVTGRTLTNLAGSAVPSPDEDDVDLEPGQGHVVRRDGQHIALARTRDGELRAVGARCTHLRCLVGWNAEAESWDCACHGSRFATDGSVLHGPAVSPLPRLAARHDEDAPTRTPHDR